MNARELKKRLKASRAAGAQYPVELRRAVLDHARSEHAQGRSWDAISRDLGLCNQTLAYWRSKSTSALVPVTVVGEAKPELPAREVTVECGPLVVRGLDVSGVAELLRRLG
jgi:hypothetical protein